VDTDAFYFGRFRLIVRERVLLKDDQPVSLGSRAFDLLLVLVEHAGETVSRKVLFERVWPDVIVAKVNLRVHIAGLRKALGDGLDGSRFIVSVSGRGYCFVASVARTHPAIPRTVATRLQQRSLPVRLERMLDRDAAVAMLSSQLSERRLIALGGPGGWGRTSVAFAIAHTLVTDFDDAMCFVDFAGIDDSSLVAITVASALGYPVECDTSPQQSLASVLAYLQDKEMLLVFDNCEHVIPGVEEFTERLFIEAPLVHILTSSREALRASGARAARSLVNGDA